MRSTRHRGGGGLRARRPGIEPMFDLINFRLQDMAACSAALRHLGAGASSMEEAADRVVRYLYTNLTTRPDGEPACVLVRLFKTHPYGRLAPELQRLADRHLSKTPASPDMKCLTLLGSQGVVAGWNDPARSSGFRVIPLAGPEALSALPMFAQLFAQFQIDLPFLASMKSSLLLDRHATTFNAFYVAHAHESPYVPAQQEFVVPFGVQSVLGYGGLLPTGDLFAVILFTRVFAPRATAELFQALALSTRLALASFDRADLVLPSPRSSTAGGSQGPLQTDLQERVATLEALLTVHEQAVEDQSRKLEGSMQALRTSEERWTAAFAGNGDGVWDWNAVTNRVFFSPRWKEMLGFTPDEIGDGLEEWSSRIHPDDQEAALADMQRHLRGETPVYVNEHRLRCKDGSSKWMLNRGKVIARNSDGTPLRVVGTNSDVTERKRAEEALAQSEERLRLTLDMTTDGLWDWTIPTSQAYYSPSWIRLLGLEQEEIQPNNVGDWKSRIHEDDRPSVDRALADHLAMRTPHFAVEHRLRHRSGEWRFISVRGQVVRRTPAGSPLRMMGTMADITDRRRIEHERRRLLYSIDHASEGFALLDRNGCFTYTNPAFARMYGYEPGDLAGASWTILFPDEWVALMEQLCWPVLAEEGRWQGELVGHTKAGDAFHVDLSLTKIPLVEDEPDVVVCSCRDISKRKQMESDLIAAKDAAEAGARAKAEFLATMSHEIRTPMNGVLGMTQLLLDTELTAEQREYTETMRHSGDQLLRIIDDILDFSKIEAGRLSFETIPFDLRVTIEDTLDLLAIAAQRKRLELVGLIDAAVPTAVLGDPGRVRQILTNLIGNAVKFTEQGEVLVQVLRADEDDRSTLLRFEVIDTGIGLSQEQRAKLFQAFTQADGSTSRKYGGTGLGLVICKRLAELMGGEIGLHSLPSAGTRVWFTARFTKTAPADGAPPAAEHLRGLRVCIADDNATNRTLLQYHASAWGMAYDTAADGEAALALLRSAAAGGAPFDLALIDMHMPGIDGLQVARAIAADPALAHTRLVLLTSLGRRGDAQVAQAAGFSAYLTKPIRKSQLYECLRLVMGHQTAADQAAPLITRHQIAELHAQSRLLVVDDNSVNQKVAVRMLEKLGHRVDVAATGNEALAALARHAYALIFMDCQMPEMDGFEATRLIREGEASQGPWVNGHSGGRNGLVSLPLTDARSPLTVSRIPIIAMTANALESDRRRCLEAGMDDFISKPVSSRELQDVLARWLSIAAQDQAA